MSSAIHRLRSLLDHIEKTFPTAEIRLEHQGGDTYRVRVVDYDGTARVGFYSDRAARAFTRELVTPGLQRQGMRFRIGTVRDALKRWPAAVLTPTAWNESLKPIDYRLALA
ncbi:hypothetical protein HOT99_gp105 [Caulobacter phage CcrBL10]|uniref:Uncharacterized protein n=1 Tax=Caulobacter phage CcrBL10 TaxID=2283269 RepID=A0A385ECC1_9CAUD|nr:hypothetical protein HOT99_gp105 [Caulobacter phage CcrBL10]AXQ68512.1 hypothetical protein CcrBL10_gp308 [Caulobacter phage CcrBL10]